MAQTIIACIPGLGFTSAVYRKLDWGDHKPIMLEWMEPAAYEESIESYAQRMLNQIPKNHQDLILIGHSFGGVMAQEMARLAKVKQIILVSSIRFPKEIPWRYRIFAPLKLDFLFRKGPSLWSLPLWGPPFGYKSKEEQDLFREMVSTQSNKSLQWSLRQLSSWRKLSPSTSPVHHIHGTDDRTLSFSKLEKVDDIVENGSHIMLYNRAEEISQLIKAVLTRQS